MATLNDLRTKGGIIVTVVIALALVAFLLGDLFNGGTNMANSRKMRVGEIEGHNVGYMEFLDESDRMNNIYKIMWGVNSFTADQMDMLNDMAWNELVMRYSYLPSFENLGYKVSEAEQVDMINGVYTSPVIASTFMDPETGVYSTEYLANFLTNVSLVPEAALMWEYMKEQMVQERISSNYTSLVEAGFYTTAFEAQQGVADANNVFKADVVAYSYSQTPDSLVTVSDNDIRAYYNEHKELFRQNPSRDVEYVVFDLLPSDADYADAKEAVEELAEEFAAAENAMQFAALNTMGQVDRYYYKESELPTAIAAVAFGARKGELVGPELNGDVYTMSRLAELKMMPDSLGASHILLPAGEQERADSLVQVIRQGGDFAALSAEFSIDSGANATGGDLGRFAPEQMIEEFSNACVEHKQGDVFTVESTYGIHVVKLTYKSTPVQKAQIATITYEVDPGDATEQEVYNNVNNFITAAAGSTEGFRQAVSDNGMSQRSVRILNTDRTINGLTEPKALIRWAFTGNVGEVSEPMQIDGNYVVATIVDSREDEYATVQQVAADIHEQLLYGAKTAYVAEQVKGLSSLEQVAEKLGAEVVAVDEVNFNSYYINGLGVEPKLVGAITKAEVGALSPAIEGVNGVYFFTVTDKSDSEAVTEESEKVRIDANNISYMSERLNQAIFEQSDVKDNRVKFF